MGRDYNEGKRTIWEAFSRPESGWRLGQDGDYREEEKDEDRNRGRKKERVRENRGRKKESEGEI